MSIVPTSHRYGVRGGPILSLSKLAICCLLLGSCSRDQTALPLSPEGPTLDLASDAAEIRITPSDPTLATGQSLQFTATASWTTSAPAVAWTATGGTISST